MTEHPKKTVSRRDFVAGSAAAAFSFHFVPSHVLGGPRAPSNRLNIAGIGVGGMGAANLKACEEENIVALCDVDDDYSAKTVQK